MRIAGMAVALVCLGMLASGGCTPAANPNFPELVPVDGTVSMDGAPLANASVVFIPAGATQGGPSYGLTDEGGRYALEYQAGQKGAPVGEFKVVCSKWVMPDGSDYVGVPGGPSPMDAGAKELLPAKYSEEYQTTLKATIPPGGGTINLEVTSK